MGLTPEQYAEEANVCPSCEVPFNLELGEFVMADSDLVQVDVVCKVCNATWTEEYKLTGYLSLEEN